MGILIMISAQNNVYCNSLSDIKCVHELMLNIDTQCFNYIQHVCTVDPRITRLIRTVRTGFAKPG